MNNVRESSVDELSANFLLKQNIINIYGEIDDGMAMSVIAQLQYLDYKFVEDKVPEADRVITLQINSPGGSVSAGLAIYDTINFVKAKVRTVVIGMAASMGAFLACSGTKGMRTALPHSEILIHQPLGGASGQASDVIIAAEHIKKVRSLLNEILAANTGKSIKQIGIDTDRDNIMSAEEAKEYGLVDVVLTTPNKALGGAQ